MIAGSGKRRPFFVRRSSIPSKAVHSVPCTIPRPPLCWKLQNPVRPV
jgi:hypothetical protein